MLTKRRWFLPTLFLIVVLQALIFATGRTAVSFFSDMLAIDAGDSPGWLTLVLYSFIIAACLATQSLSRRFGIKAVLMASLVSNCAALAFFSLFYALFSESPFFAYAALILGMAVLGVAIGLLVTALSSFAIIAFPKALALGLIILYSGLNFGISIAKTLFSYFQGFEGLYLSLLALSSVFSLFFIRAFFPSPQIPAHLNERRKMTNLAHRLKGRLWWFVAAMVLYGLCEYTFNIFGYDYISLKANSLAADESQIVFWQALNIGELFIGLPAFWIRPAKVAAVLPILIIAALILLPFQTEGGAFILNMIIAGLGCSAIFPLLLAALALEVIEKEKEEAAPELESASGYMVAAYHLGTGLIILQNIVFRDVLPEAEAAHFKVAIIYAAALALLFFYFNKAAARKKA